MSIYETHIIQNPELPFIFHSDFHLYPKYGFGPGNWHENVEIISVIEGRGIVASDAEHTEVSCGDTVIINANRLHSFAALDHPFAYRCLIVDRSFCLANHFDTNTIEFDVQFRDEEITRLINRLNDEYTLPEQTPYRTQTIRAAVLELMAILCRSHSHPAPANQGDSRLLSSIKQAIGYIRSESHRDLSLDEVSSFAGLSKYYFAREFRRITGYTFVSYLNLTRCENAKRMLAENVLSVGEVGKACGFENRSYFTRTFQSYTGRIPSVYRGEKICSNKKKKH